MPNETLNPASPKLKAALKQYNSTAAHHNRAQQKLVQSQNAYDLARAAHTAAVTHLTNTLSGIVHPPLSNDQILDELRKLFSRPSLKATDSLDFFVGSLHDFWAMFDNDQLFSKYPLHLTGDDLDTCANGKVQCLIDLISEHLGKL